jgi:hypothetical protein
VQSGRINNDEFDDTQNVAPAVVPVIPSERRNIRNSSEILGTVGASGQEKRATSKNEGQGTRDYSKNKRVCLLCAKSDDTKLKNRAILSRGGDYQIIIDTKTVLIPAFHLLKSKAILCQLITSQCQKV